MLNKRETAPRGAPRGRALRFAVDRGTRAESTTFSEFAGKTPSVVPGPRITGSSGIARCCCYHPRVKMRAFRSQSPVDNARLRKMTRSVYGSLLLTGHLRKPLESLGSARGKSTTSVSFCLHFPCFSRLAEKRGPGGGDLSGAEPRISRLHESRAESIREISSVANPKTAPETLTRVFFPLTSRKPTRGDCQRASPTRWSLPGSQRASL